MRNEGRLDEKQRRTMAIVVAYPIVILALATALNVWIPDVAPYSQSLLSPVNLKVLSVVAILLTINHTWLMTATELKRVRYRMYATPEEWATSGTRRQDVPPQGNTELERVHNAHRAVFP